MTNLIVKPSTPVDGAVTPLLTQKRDTVDGAVTPKSLPQSVLEKASTLASVLPSYARAHTRTHARAHEHVSGHIVMVVECNHTKIQSLKRHNNRQHIAQKTSTAASTHRQQLVDGAPHHMCVTGLLTLSVTPNPMRDNTLRVLLGEILAGNAEAPGPDDVCNMPQVVGLHGGQNWPVWPYNGNFAANTTTEGRWWSYGAGRRSRRELGVVTCR